MVKTKFARKESHNFNNVTCGFSRLDSTIQMIFLEFEIGTERVVSHECLRISSLWCSYRVYSRIVFRSYTQDTYRLSTKDDRVRKILETLSFFSLSLSLSWFRFPLSFVAMLFVSELTPRNVFIDRLLLFFLRSLATRCRSRERSLWNDTPRACRRYMYIRSAWLTKISYIWFNIYLSLGDSSADEISGSTIGWK